MFEPSAIFNLFFPRAHQIARRAVAGDACCVLPARSFYSAAPVPKQHAADVLVVSLFGLSVCATPKNGRYRGGCDAIIGCLLHSRCREVLVVSVVVFG